MENDNLTLKDHAFWEEIDNEADAIWKDKWSDADRIRYIRKFRARLNFVSLSEMRAVCKGAYFIGHGLDLVRYDEETIRETGE